MKKEVAVLQDFSRKFEPHELFFSTTDRKGIITSCNEIFVRISGYEPQALIGKPHNIIRHPHMPRCVFKILWDYLLSGRAIGAYVKNRALTGEYYWVYALVTPIENGFLSVRLKPTTPILAVVEELYKELSRIEQSSGSDWRDGMTKAGTTLLQKLLQLKFDSYDEFMAETLRQELESHRIYCQKSATTLNASKDLQTRIESVFASLQSVGELRNILQSERGFLQNFQHELSLHALNSGVRASRLADAGRALSVISTEISALSQQISSDAMRLSTSLDDLSQALSVTSFNVSLVSLQNEVADYFACEQSRNPLSVEDQIQQYGRPVKEIQVALHDACNAALDVAQTGILTLRRSLTNFHDIAESLARILLTIQFSYVTGKTLSASVQGGASFGVLLEELISLADTARHSLTNLKDSVVSVGSTAAQWNLSNDQAKKNLLEISG